MTRYKPAARAARRTHFDADPTRPTTAGRQHPLWSEMIRVGVLRREEDTPARRTAFCALRRRIQLDMAKVGITTNWRVAANRDIDRAMQSRDPGESEEAST